MAQNPDSIARLAAGQTAAAYVLRKFGAPTRLVPNVQIGVGSTPSRVAKNNPRRLEIIIVNQGTGNIFLDFNSGVAVGVGLFLAPLGGSLVATIDEDGELVTSEWWAVAPSGSNALDSWEVETL